MVGELDRIDYLHRLSTLAFRRKRKRNVHWSHEQGPLTRERDGRMTKDQLKNIRVVEDIVRHKSMTYRKEKKAVF